MIAQLTGTPILFDQGCIVDVHGVGYEVHVSSKTIQCIQNKETITLFIHTHVREDALELYGFSTKEERKLFQKLLSASGVGPKTALAITAANVDQIVRAVKEGDVDFFAEFPRVGKKLAQKIIIELKPALGSMQDLILAEPTNTLQEELQGALKYLGYPEQQVRQVIRLPELQDLPIQQAIKVAVQKIAKLA